MFYLDLIAESESVMRFYRSTRLDMSRILHVYAYLEQRSEKIPAGIFVIAPNLIEVKFYSAISDYSNLLAYVYTYVVVPTDSTYSEAGNLITLRDELIEIRVKHKMGVIVKI